MPQVPYVPYPTERPSPAGTPSVHLDTPGAAFGENIGQALGQLGRTIEGAGGELFSRAVALQQLNNETEAKEADAQYMIAAGKLHADYSTLEGRAAKLGFNKYQQDLNATRTQIRAGLSNDMARRMYDSSSLSTMGRSIFNGAGHAATEDKKWHVSTIVDQMKLDAKTVEDNPRDDVLFQDKLNRVRSSAGELAEWRNLEPGSPQEKLQTLTATSNMWRQRITGLSETKPFEAMTMLEKHSTEMTEDDLLKLRPAVQAKARSVATVNVAEAVYFAGKGTDEKPSQNYTEMEQAAREAARKLAPNDALFEQHTVAALRGIYNQNKYVERQEFLENWQKVNGAIVPGVRTEQDLRTDPTVSAAIDALPKDKQRDIPGIINRTNAARDKVSNEEAERRIWGTSNNDVIAFLDMDLTKAGLGYSDLKKYQALQQKYRDNPQRDPRVDQAKRILRGSMGAQLEALGIYMRKESNKDDYDYYTGTLASALDVWRDTHGKPATAKDIIETIGPQVIRQRSVPGWLYGTNTEPFYKPDTNSKEYKDFSTKYRTEMQESDGIEPDTARIDRAYNRYQLMKLYGKPRSK